MARDDLVAGRLARALETRFGEKFAVDAAQPGLADLAHLAEHRSHRTYDAQPVAPALLRLLFACALSAPSKSDLQQGDIVLVADVAKRKAIASLIPDMPWVKAAPVFLIFCGNNRRQRQLAEWRGKPFVNDHLDAFMNAAVDAGIVLANFIRAASAAGLGCCPISAVRNHAATISDLLELPDWVFPLAGLCVGYPAEAGKITPRLPLAVTVHTDRFTETDTRAQIDAYDQRRAKLVPYAKQRDNSRFGKVKLYGWSEDKARQYAEPERADWGAFIKARGFRLE